MLALLSQGAEGSTFEELRRGLHLTENKTLAANQFQEHYNSLQRGIGDSVLSIANQIYVQEGHQVKKAFQDVAVGKFASGVESLNFANSVESAQSINQFVENKTNHLIKDLIKPDMVDASTRMVLVNAIYFKGNWKYQFDEKRTIKGDFYTNETEKVKADFMHLKKRFNFAELEELNATALEMRYFNSNFSFVIILPNNRTGLHELETKLKNYDLSQISSQMVLQEVDVTIPKFKAEFEINLNEVLKNVRFVSMDIKSYL